MSESNSGSEEPWEKYLKYAISAFVSVTHVIAFFQIVICSRHLAVAFNIPPKNIGIYFPKLYGLRSVLMSMACGIEYLIYRIIQISTGSNNAAGSNSNTAKDVRKYLSMAWFVLLTVCEISFLCVLYFSRSVAFHNYIVLNLEGMFFGFFQMSILSLIPEFATYYMLSLYVSGTSIFIIQTIIDRCTKNSMLSVKIQAWVCVICSVLCVPLWFYYLIKLFKDTTKNTDSSGSKPQESNGGNSNGSGGSTTTTSNSGTCSSRLARSADGFHVHPSVALDQHDLKMEYLMTMNSVTILKIMTDQLDRLCSQLSSEAVANVRILMTRLQQITREQDISYEVLVAIDLVILGLKKCQCPESQLCLLAELSLFLRMKVLIKPLEDQNEQTTFQEESYVSSNLDLQNGGKCSTGEPVVVAAGTHRQLIRYVRIQAPSRAKRSIPEPKSRGRCDASSEQISQSSTGSGKRRRQKRSTEPENKQQSGSGKKFHEQLFESLSQLMMFPIGSLVKDFLFPGVIPFALLERDKCHLINLIVIIFLSVGPVTIFIINQVSSLLKKNVDPYHWFWIFMIPKIVILIISLCAIHTKQGCTHKIRSSQPIVLFMTVVVLTCYGFLETMSFVGMGFYVKIMSCDPKPFDLLAIHNVFGKFFRYLVYKLSVGYNKTRISAGFVLPSFKPPEPIPNAFGFWCKGSFSNGWKDLAGDFKMGIKQYLEVAPTVSKKSPIETLRYCDIFM